MNPASLAAAMTNAQMGSARMALAAKMLKMKADAHGSIAQVLDAAQQNVQRLANTGAGVGRHLDISV